jgi:single-strand DNA-binding protein
VSEEPWSTPGSSTSADAWSTPGSFGDDTPF